MKNSAIAVKFVVLKHGKRAWGEVVFLKTQFLRKKNPKMYFLSSVLRLLSIKTYGFEVCESVFPSTVETYKVPVVSKIFLRTKFLPKLFFIFGDSEVQ